jgi:mRNA-degrading endonuclease RelE of RelBE toxin-antitoxin system
MEYDPFAGDVIPLKNEQTSFRRRVGDWRIFFDVDSQNHVVDVPDIKRRTTTTYRKKRN